MISMEFEVAIHEEYGDLGFRPCDMPNADPLTGMAVAHDMLEHFANDRGTVEDELQALGAMLFVRGGGFNWGYNRYWMEIGNVNNPWDHIASDFSFQTNYMIQRGDSLMLREPPRTTRLDDEFELIIGKAVHFATITNDDNDVRTSEWCKLPRVQGWMRLGCRRARARYRNRGDEVYECFKLIQDKADRLLKVMDEGSRIVIYANIKACEVNVKEFGGEYDDEAY